MSLYYRDGREFQGTPEIVKGKPVVHRQTKCSRCGGAGGADKWTHTGWTCYQCGGKGLGPIVADKLYTKEKLDKMNAAQAARDAKRAAESAARVAKIDAERNARRVVFLAENAEIIKLAESLQDSFIDTMLQTIVDHAAITERQVEVIRSKAAEIARKNAAQFVGTIGERREFTCTLKKVMVFEGHYGKSYMHLMRDSENNTIKYKGSKLLGNVRWEGERGDHYPVIVDQNEAFKFIATVDSYEEYKGEKQTVVSRPKEVEDTCK